MMDKESLRKQFTEREPFARLLKIRLLNLIDGRAEMELLVTSRLLNANNVVMGGVIVVLADMAAPYAAMTLLNNDEVLATIRASVKFIKPIILQDNGLIAIALAGKLKLEKDDKQRIQKIIDVKVEIISKKTNAQKALYGGTFLVLPKLIMKKIIEREQS
ncbi:MAG: PaaI family thioesterase [Candidatus Nealsonbacteria bacterium]|nr:PaaI family thioesterase [Candidatus Nealsonbacteria bacterium]